jgi:hypothetical protein
MNKHRRDALEDIVGGRLVVRCECPLVLGSFLPGGQGLAGSGFLLGDDLGLSAGLRGGGGSRARGLSLAAAWASAAARLLDFAAACCSAAARCCASCAGPALSAACREVLMTAYDCSGLQVMADSPYGDQDGFRGELAGPGCRS